MANRSASFTCVLGAGLSLALTAVSGHASELSDPPLRQVVEENRRLAEQVKAQQAMIDALAAKVSDLQKNGERRDAQLRDLRERTEAASPAVTPAPSPGRSHEVRIAGEAGIAFFNTGSAGQFPKAEFRVDDPVITLEAPVWEDVYFFTELKLLTRETNAENFQLGELYVEFEGLGRTWGHPESLNVRAGRVDIPFGEEYLVRGPVANPLISHSLGDLWGVDEGVEIYGRVGPLNYVFAVQNGGQSRLHDFNADKSLAARIGWDPAGWLHVSASAMRTGELATVADNLSEVWFANGFFRALGPAKTTSVFWASLYEADATARWDGGHLSLALGQARFGDSDTAADNSRRIRYGYAEVVQAIVGSLYGAVRYSEIRAPGGYPLTGWGAPGTFFFRPSLTEELRRLSVGLGYRFGAPLVLKLEYAAESGRMTGGTRRDDEDFFGAEVGLKF